MNELKIDFPSNAIGTDMVFDAESNGLLFDKKEYSKAKGLIIHKAATRIWMVCHRDPLTGQCFDFIDDEMLLIHSRSISRHNRSYGRKDVKVYPLSHLPSFWEITGVQSGHNSMKFDFPLVEKLLKYLV